MSHGECMDNPDGAGAGLRADSVSMSGNGILTDLTQVLTDNQHTFAESSAGMMFGTTDDAPVGADVAPLGADGSPTGVDGARKSEKVIWARGGTKSALLEVLPDVLWMNMETHHLGMASCVVDVDLEAEAVKAVVEQCTFVLDAADVVTDTRLPGTFVVWPKRYFREGKWAVAQSWSQDSSPQAIRTRLKKACGKGSKFGLQLRFGRPGLLVQCAHASSAVTAMAEAKRMDLEVDVLASPAAASLWFEVTAPPHVGPLELSAVVRAQRKELAEKYPGCVFGDADSTFVGYRCLVTVFTTINVAAQFALSVKDVRVRFVVPGDTSTVPRANVLKSDSEKVATEVAANVKKRLVSQVEKETGVKVGSMGEDGAESDSSKATDEQEGEVMEAAMEEIVAAVKTGLESVLPTLARAGVTDAERVRLGKELGDAVPEGVGEALAYIEKWKTVHSASDVAMLLGSRGVAVSWADRLRSVPQPPPASAWNRAVARKPKAGIIHKKEGPPKKGK